MRSTGVGADVSLSEYMGDIWEAADEAHGLPAEKSLTLASTLEWESEHEKRGLPAEKSITLAPTLEWESEHEKRGLPAEKSVSLATPLVWESEHEKRGLPAPPAAKGTIDELSGSTGIGPPPKPPAGTKPAVEGSADGEKAAAASEKATDQPAEGKTTAEKGEKVDAASEKVIDQPADAETAAIDEPVSKRPRVDEEAIQRSLQEYEFARRLADALGDAAATRFPGIPPAGSGFLFDKTRRRVRVFTDKAVTYLEPSPQLKYMLGFHEDQILVHNTLARYDVDITGGIAHFYVHCPGLTEPIILGNRMISLLRVISASGSFGETVERIFENPVFCKTSQKQINSVRIELRTMSGGLLPMMFGHVIVSLVFRKTSVF